MSDAGQVGNTKLFENDKVILWEFILEPGERTAMHTHQHDYTWYAIEGAMLEVFDEDEKYIGAFDVPTGSVYSWRIEGDELVSTTSKDLRAPARHVARNASPHRYREILVETKR